MGLFDTKLHELQKDLQQLYPQTLGVVDADMQAILTSAAADHASGKLDDLKYSQMIACPNAILALTQEIQKLVGTTIPDGAGVGWILYQAKMLQENDLDTFLTQVKLVKGTCSSMIPGLTL